MLHRRNAARGQSFVEFALILPILLTMLGAIIDVARLYSAWITLESATRDASEYVATLSATSSAAVTDAKSVVCLQAAGLGGFVSPPGNAAACTQPAVTVVTYDRSTTATGATTRYPIVTATVRSTLAFSTLFPYPLFTQGGAWTLSSTRTFQIIQGR